MAMVSVGCLIGPSPPDLDGRLRLMSRDQAIASASDEVPTPRLEQAFPHHEMVLRLGELEPGPLHHAVSQTARDMGLPTREGIKPHLMRAKGDFKGHVVILLGSFFAPSSC
jgi:hypothetical protein